MWILLVSLFQGAAAPDLVILNATFPTVPGMDALVISGGKITAVTTSDKAAQLKATKVIDADGRVVLPGLIDSHIHFQSGGFAEERLKLVGAKSVAELQARIKSYADAHQDLSVIRGRGWAYDLFKAACPPDR